MASESLCPPGAPPAQAASSPSPPAPTSCGLRRRPPPRPRAAWSPPPPPAPPRRPAGGSCTGRWSGGRCGTARGTCSLTRTGGCGARRIQPRAGGRRACLLENPRQPSARLPSIDGSPPPVVLRPLCPCPQVLAEYADYADEALRSQRFGPGHPTVRAVRGIFQWAMGCGLRDAVALRGLGGNAGGRCPLLVRRCVLSLTGGWVCGPRGCFSLWPAAHEAAAEPVHGRSEVADVEEPRR